MSFWGQLKRSLFPYDTGAALQINTERCFEQHKLSFFINKFFFRWKYILG